jgi:hypothetical protein
VREMGIGALRVWGGNWGCRGLALLVWGYLWYIFDGSGGVLGGEAGWR